MKIYVDFDDVLVDTYNKVNELKRKDQTHREFITSCDWNDILKDVQVINDSINYLKNTKLDVNILSKVSTLNEAEAKVNFLRRNGVKINIYIVPHLLKKDDIVCAKGNILVDDKIYNLDNWTSAGGIGIFFNKDNNHIDVYGKKNNKYPLINNLDLLISGIQKYL